MEGKLSGQEKRVGDFDLFWDDGPVAPVGTSSQVWLAEVLSTLSSSSIAGPNGQPGGPKVGHQLAFGGGGATGVGAFGGTGVGSANTGLQPQQKTDTLISFLIPFPRLNSYLGCLPCRTSFQQQRQSPKSLDVSGEIFQTQNNLEDLHM
ncbi:unnamed protein product [Schistocephalus solidus]|uniref:Uncharacterized protein n=1 Tax=Schistocephalus solidus TaxID=70667 RepID=A0A183TT12_SCHSO|nr:unnamed protein product [Schistocephalus solidus]